MKRAGVFRFCSSRAIHVIDSASSRSLTAKALRRSWHEPAVRTWWLCAALMLVVTGWLSIDQLQTGRRSRFRIEHWRRADAKIARIGVSVRGTYRPSVDQLATMDVLLNIPDGKGGEYDWEGRLTAQNTPRSPGETLPVFVDPEHRDRVTDRVTPLPLFEELMAPLMMAPLLILFTGLAFWQRSRMLRLWRKGASRRGLIMGITNSAIAPGTAMLHCALEDSHDRRLISVAVPRSVAKLKTGDSLNIVVLPDSPGRAIAAMLYE